VRWLPILALAVVACSRSDGRAASPPVGGGNGPDAILVRVPREGGVERAYRWGTDSVMWSSSGSVPRLERMLAFDDEQGALAYVDTRGVPGRLNLRLGSADAATPGVLASVSTADGWALFGLTAKREVSRVTPSGTWTFKPDRDPSALLPIADGSLVLVNDDGHRMQLRRLHPPESRVTDTASVPRAQLVVHTELGDRLYFPGDSGLAGVRVRDFTRTNTVKLPAPADDAVATPSGDRIFVAMHGRKSIAVIDRFTEDIEQSIEIGHDVSALRMDPDGRYVLVRDVAGDSVSVVSLGASRVIGRVRSTWRNDLPLVGPDGRLALLQDNDVVLVDAETHRTSTHFLAGAQDLWTLIRWNGFRPRAQGLDEPVRFAADSDSTAAVATGDSTSAVAGAANAAAVAPPSVASVPRPPDAPAPADTRRPPPPVKRAFTLSFAALLSEDRARVMATGIKVDGKPVRVVPSMREGTQVYRIVFGPFDTREEAERTGRRTGLPYWVYEGAP
jgi:cell division septation protein DedD